MKSERDAGMDGAALEFDVAVIGGGITGATIAAALVEQGVRTVLVERGSCGAHGASAYSGGIVRLYDADPAVMALAAWSHACLRSTGYGRAFDHNIQRMGVSYTGPAEATADMREAIRRYGGAAGPMRLLAGAQVREINGLGQARPGCTTLYEAGGGTGDVRGSVRSMIRLVREGGGAVLEHAALRRLEQHAGGATLWCGGQAIRARVAVLAAGAWSAALAPELGLQVRSIPLLRMMASAAPAMPVIDTVAGTYVVPLAGRLVHVGTQVRSSAASPEQLPPPGAAGEQQKYEQERDGRRRLAQLSGSAEDGTLFDVLPGFDCYAADGKPVLGFLAEDDARYVATGMAGIGYKLAPAVAALAVQDIARRLGRPVWAQAQAVADGLAAPFRPGRGAPLPAVATSGSTATAPARTSREAA